MNAQVWIAALSHAAVLAIIAGLQFLMPKLTRPDLLFAVTIDPAFRETEEARLFIRRFQGQIILLAVAALALSTVGSIEHYDAFFPVAILGFLVASMVAFQSARRRTLPHATAPVLIREAQLTQRRMGLPGGWLLQAGPFLILAIASLWVALHWSAIPSRISLPSAAHPSEVKWVDKSVAYVFVALIAGGVEVTLLLLLSLLIGRTRRINAGGAAGASEGRFRRVVQISLLVLSYWLACGDVVLTAMIAGASAKLFYLAELGAPVLLLAFIIIYVRVGQGGSRLAGAHAGLGPIGDRTRDELWKWGMFYVNRDDPALIVEKRFGIGYTFNFGRVGTWVILAAIVLVPLALRFGKGLIRG